MFAFGKVVYQREISLVECWMQSSIVCRGNVFVSSERKRKGEGAIQRNNNYIPVDQPAVQQAEETC